MSTISKNSAFTLAKNQISTSISRYLVWGKWGNKTVHYFFDPNFKVVATFPGVATTKDLEEEKSIANATREEVQQRCGKIANGIIDLIPDSYFADATQRKLQPLFDIRVDRFKKHESPFPDHWHCDGNHMRDGKFVGFERRAVSTILIATVSDSPTGVSNTKFLDEKFSIDSQAIKPDFYQIHETIERRLQKKKINVMKDGDLVHLDGWTLHCSAPATVDGIRLFFRATFSEPLPPEVRKLAALISQLAPKKTSGENRDDRY